ncbi:hypothetical protein DRP53_04035 [candidate division WOR-3 bacterium]|uniref:Uncharacterized protein n=1 Tax=candidate division WOR-3 bacterium TaxID=2052148 RepID=A0A660SL29_UNCW3|nr:MAG: hypothetical protein DRP53_04035 [candidate division WOR-3 bacterium]
MISILIFFQIGSSQGFEENLLPIVETILIPRVTPYTRASLDLALDYSYYRYFPYDDDFPYLPAPSITGIYRLTEGKTINPILRNLGSFFLRGRIGLYPKQSGTDRHLPYFNLGITLGLLGESIFLPALGMKISGTRIKNLTILPEDPYYRIRTDYVDAIDLSLELRKLIRSWQLAIIPTYHRVWLRGWYFGYQPPQPPERLGSGEIAEFRYDSSLTKIGFTFGLIWSRFGLYLSRNTGWQISLTYRIGD